jgi:hypothetical protein
MEASSAEERGFEPQTPSMPSTISTFPEESLCFLGLFGPLLALNIVQG